MTTMKSGTAAYWLPITVSSIDKMPSDYTGYQGKNQQDIHEWLEKGLHIFEDIYGTVVDVHYITEEVRTNEKGKYDFINIIVVTGIVDSEMHFSELSHEDWPQDLTEQLLATADKVEKGNIVGYDLNPIGNDPIWSKFNP